MESPLNQQQSEIFDELFSFYGTLNPDGEVIHLRGMIFAKTFTDPLLLVGHKFTDTVFWQSSEQNYEMVKTAVEAAGKGIKSKTILSFRVSADEKRIVELALCPVFAGDNGSRRIDYIFLSGQDVTDREKEVEFYKKRSEQLLYAAENADIGLWFWDLAEGKIFSTPKCNEFFEMPPHELLTYPSILETIHPDDRDRIVDEITGTQHNGEEYDIEYRVIHSDGSVHWLSTRGKTYLDAEGEPATMMGVVRQITERKNADEELARVYEMEKRARDEAEEANRTKDYFLALVSHELRSPLNAVLGWTKILLTKEVDADTRRNALETIERSATSQAKLISDLVDSARIASGKLRLELRPANLYDILKTVYNSQRPAAESKGIHLDFTYESENVQVFGDLVRLQQVFTNLLTNALKFTPEGGRINLNLTTTPDSAIVAVKDDGRGISPETLPRIFRQFSQGDENLSRENGGLGLGLSIVKTLVEKHEGRVTASSDGLGRGAEFIVRLPLYVSDAAPSPVRAEPLKIGQKALSDLKILFVEDDMDSREVLQLFLEQNGATVESVDSASKALAALDRRAGNGLYDLIISDLAMPLEDGYSMISRIRTFPPERGGRIPAMALSAFATKENKEKALSVGFQKYHTKPFEPDTLINDILALVKND